MNKDDSGRCMGLIAHVHLRLIVTAAVAASAARWMTTMIINQLLIGKM